MAWTDRLEVKLIGSFRRWRRVVLVAAIASAVCAPFVYSAIELARFERADARRATFIYAAGQSLAPGIYVQRIGLAATLSRLGYAETRAIPASPGQFRRVGSDWELVPRGIEERGSKAGLVRLHVVDERIQRVTRAGEEVTDLTLEPEVLASALDRPGEDHRPVRFDEVPRILIDAVLAAEDHRFFEHGGLDPRALARAAWA